MALKSCVAAIWLAVCMLAEPATAGQLEDGIAAYGHGDYAAALHLWRPLADQGNADAEWRLGDMFYYGQGVQKNYPEAAKWYRKAADQGDVWSQHKLANMFYEGEGVPQDIEQAHMWANLATAGSNLADRDINM